MVKIEVSAELGMPAAQMFVERDSPAFQALLAKALNLAIMEIRDTWPLPNGEPGEVVQLMTKPDIEQYVPKRLKKMINFDMVFLDEIMYRKKDIQGPVYTLEVHSKLPFLKDGQYSIINMLTIEPLGPDRCRQSLKGDVDIRVFGVGAVVQGIVLNSLNSAYKVLPEIVEKWKVVREDLGMVGRLPKPAAQPSAKLLQTLQTPFKELPTQPEQQLVPVSEEAGPKEKKQANPRDYFKNQLKTESALYFDALEVLDGVEEDDEVTREAALSDRAELVEALSGLEGDEAPPQVVLTKVKLPAQHSEVSIPDHEKRHGPRHWGVRDAWNENMREWQEYFHHMGVKSARLPKVGRRLGHLLSGLDAMGLLAREESMSSLGASNVSTASLGSRKSSTSTHVHALSKVVSMPYKVGEGVVHTLGALTLSSKHRRSSSKQPTEEGAGEQEKQDP